MKKKIYCLTCTKYYKLNYRLHPLILSPNFLFHFSYTTLYHIINFYSFAFLISVAQKKKKKKNPKHLTADPPPPKFADGTNKRLPVTSMPAIHHHNQHSFGFLFFCLISKALKLSAPIYWSRSANSSHKVKWISLEVWLFMVCWVG